MLCDFILFFHTNITYSVFFDPTSHSIHHNEGITQKLDHFVDIGVDILWIGPIFKSPMYDMGYDVEDSKKIDPIYGTMDDFMELISEMDKRSNI